MNLKVSEIEACVLIPTYNNAKTLTRVIDGVLEYAESNEVIVINDGSTDDTIDVLTAYGDRINLLSYEKNKGKGHALKLGFKEAISKGFEYALTIDSDGQHFPDDIPNFIKKSKENPGALLMGSRNMEQEGVPAKSSFGNKFSNFWYKLETGIELPDTQTGYRLYPLEPLKKMNLFTTKFETEIEVIVKMAWKDVEVLPVDVKVLYDPDERVSHFRPFKDFTRISILNTYLVTLTLLYYLPRRLFKASKKKEFWIELKNSIIQPNESTFIKALSIGFGFFMGVLPIWGFQLLIGIPLSIYFRMNKALFIIAANISLPPLVPFIIYGSYKLGGLFFESKNKLPEMSNITLETIHVNFVQYFVGGISLAISLFLIGGVTSYVLIKTFRKK